jgi:hypothetical protein
MAELLQDLAKDVHLSELEKDLPLMTEQLEAYLKMKPGIEPDFATTKPHGPEEVVLKFKLSPSKARIVEKRLGELADRREITTGEALYRLCKKP